MAAFVACYVAAVSLGTVVHGSMSAWAFLYFFLLSFSVVAIHEIGHLAAARIAGMTPIGLQVALIYLRATRRGWRVHWRRAVRKTGGFAMAYPDPDRSLRKQYLTMSAGGPVANFLSAALFFAALLMVRVPSMKVFLIALGTAHVLTGLANLLPTRGVLRSDGMMMLDWWNGSLERDPAIVNASLAGRSVRGTTAERLPEEDIALVESQPQPLGLCGFWYRLKAAQNRHDWQEADKLGTALERSLESSAPENAAMNPLLLDICRAEIAFSRAMLHRDARALDVPLPKSVAEWTPEIVSRVAALRAALVGDVATRDRRIADCARQAAKSVDRSLDESEARLRAAILDIPAVPLLAEAAVAA